ncbi:hypothetical protein EWM64_g8395 [Hericium alpestre]|uniref:Uncharacterized protein n=1 Tax=Hericium alpestre TaxID=135208 RepID=A0A4Y9ZQ50_9AGAM|nr:hypothetical protein EWM64_g8395 [Hericium alpestre]
MSDGNYSTEGIPMPPPSVYIDLLSNKLGLTGEQVSDLQTLATFGAEIPPGDLLLRIYGYCQGFRTQNLLEKLLNKDTNLNEVVKDMKSLTTVKWVPDDEQKAW